MDRQNVPYDPTVGVSIPAKTTRRDSRFPRWLSRLCPWYKPHSLDPWPSIVRQCVLGLEHLHKNKIRHKDLKPDNILLVDGSNGASLDSKVRAVIADLGISKGYVEAENTTFNGTEQYLAPRTKGSSIEYLSFRHFLTRLQHFMDPCPPELEAMGAVPGKRTEYLPARRAIPS